MPAYPYLTSASFSLPARPLRCFLVSPHLIAPAHGIRSSTVPVVCKLRVCDVLPTCDTGAHTHSGLLSFASTTLVLSLVNAQSTGVHTPNVVVGMALFVGGLAQLLAGMWEFAAGNTFGATGE